MRIHTPQDLGHAIRARRKELGLDQAEVARRVAVSRQWLVEVEKGKPRAEIGLLLRTLKALDLELWLGPPSIAEDPALAIDLDAVVDKAKGKRE